MGQQAHEPKNPRAKHHQQAARLGKWIGRYSVRRYGLRRSDVRRYGEPESRSWIRNQTRKQSRNIGAHGQEWIAWPCPTDAEIEAGPPRNSCQDGWGLYRKMVVEIPYARAAAEKSDGIRYGICHGWRGQQ